MLIFPAGGRIMGGIRENEQIGWFSRYPAEYNPPHHHGCRDLAFSMDMDWIGTSRGAITDMHDRFTRATCRR